MSRTAVIVALLVALVLGGVALFVTSKGGAGGGGGGGSGGGTSAATGLLLSFDPAKVTEVRMDFPDGTFQAMQRDPVFEWKIVLGGTGTPARSWPAAAAQYQGALRVLGNLTPDRPGDGSISKPAGTLRINAGSQTLCTIVFGEQRLGGKVLVEAGAGGGAKRMAWIDAQIADMMVTTGPQAWRSPAALPGVGAEVSRITMKAQNGKPVSLARVQGKWALREPVAAPADADEINRLIGILGRVQIVDFCDKGPPTVTGLENPAATLAVETDERDASGALTTIKQTLTVGQAADMSRQTVVARLDRTATGKGEGAYSMVVIVAGEGLAAINTNPTTYISKRAIQVAAEDVGQVEFIPNSFIDADCRPIQRRTADGWESRCGKGEWAPATPEQVSRNESLLKLISATPADLVSIQDQSEYNAAFTGTGTANVKLLTPGGDLLAQLVLHVKDTQLNVYSDGMKREYKTAGTAMAPFMH